MPKEKARGDRRKREKSKIRLRVKSVLRVDGKNKTIKPVVNTKTTFGSKTNAIAKLRK